MNTWNKDVLPVLCGCLEGTVRPDFYGFPYRVLSEGFIRERQRVVVACAAEVVFAVCSLPLAAWRGGISKASTGINVVLMFIALWGMIASTRADYLWVAAHSALVFGLVFIFVIYILLSIAFGNGDSESLIVIFVFAFILVDLVIACMTAHFSWTIFAERRRLKRLDAAELARIAANNVPAVAVAVARNDGVVAAAAPAAGRAHAPQAGGQGGAHGRGVARKTAAPGPDPPASALTPASRTGAVAVAVAAPDNQDDAGDDDVEECVVCMARPRNAWLYRCGHNVVCMPCGELLKQNGEPCPVCRAAINDVVRKY